MPDNPSEQISLGIFAVAAGLTAGAVLAQPEGWRSQADVKKQGHTPTVTMVDRSCTGNGYAVTGKVDLLVPVTGEPDGLPRRDAEYPGIFPGVAKPYKVTR